jgi:zinc/manganese transport system substrate-binding protein
MPTRASVAAVVLACVAGLTTAGCSSGSGSVGGSSGTITVVATINAWGSILAQLGGSRVREVSLITNPDTDPHDYEPTPADARTIATAGLLVENGVGYDAWADRALAANPVAGRVVVKVGSVVGVPDGGNPHRWYSPTDVETVAGAITTALKKIDPTDSGYFDQQHRSFVTSGLADYHRLINQIRSTYAGVPVGASESIFAPLAGPLGLHLVTPPSFLRAISEGIDPSAADKATIDAQIRDHAIKAYVFNTQNGTPDVTAQVNAAKAAGIPVVSITETLTPATASFQQWQVTQLRALQAALRSATGR